MDNTSLKLFLHLSESLHYGRTSQSCNISPSALSRQIQRMEDEVGHRLFERDNRKVILTRAGAIFKDYAKTVLEKWQLMMDELADDQSILKGEIRIYCSLTASLSILSNLLGAFRTTYPGVNIRLHTGDAGVAIQKVARGEMDIAVAPLPPHLPKNLDFKILTETSLVFIAPKIPWEFSSAIKNRMDWKEVPMILSEHGVAREKTDAWFKKKNVQPKIYALVSGHEAILSMVSLGCGIGVVPRLVLDKSPIRKNVAILDVKPEISPYAVGMCIQKRKMKSRLVQAFWNIDGV